MHNLARELIKTATKRRMEQQTNIPKWLANTVPQAREIKEEIDFLCNMLYEARGENKIPHLKNLANARDRIVNLQRRWRGYLTLDKLETLDKFLQAQARMLKKETGIKFSVAKDPIGLLNVLFVDTETTGLEYEDEPIGIGLILVEANKYTGEISREFSVYSGLRYPNCDISPGAYAVHRLSKAKLRGQDFDYEVLTRMFMHSNLCVAHNARFDARMLRHFLSSLREHLPDVGYIEWACSCWDIDWNFNDRKLDTICKELGVPRNSPHRALDDARAVMRALQHQAPNGKPYLANLFSQPRVASRIGRF